VTLDPGLAFGTGHHPTTAYCLQEIVRNRPIKPSVAPSFLDVGTGSGILPIAAAKFGYGPIVAVDNSPESVAVARANIRRNRVSHKIQLLIKDIRRAAPARGRYDLVCANLIGDLLVEQRLRLTSSVVFEGRLVLAGILAAEFAGVQAAYEKMGMRLEGSSQSGEWRSGTFVWESAP
jgi:ribosomal protein L11 methyltransferase